MAATKERIELDPRKFLAKLNGDWTSEKYNAGEKIYSQGEFAAVFCVKTGTARITVTSKTGKSAVPAILEPDEFFSVNCLFDLRLRRATASATTSCVILRLEREAMTRALRDEPMCRGHSLATCCTVPTAPKTILSIIFSIPAKSA